VAIGSSGEDYMQHFCFGLQHVFFSRRQQASLPTTQSNSEAKADCLPSRKPIWFVQDPHGSPARPAPYGTGLGFGSIGDSSLGLVVRR